MADLTSTGILETSNVMVNPKSTIEAFISYDSLHKAHKVSCINNGNQSYVLRHIISIFEIQIIPTACLTEKQSTHADMSVYL